MFHADAWCIYSITAKKIRTMWRPEEDGMGSICLMISFWGDKILELELDRGGSCTIL